MLPVLCLGTTYVAQPLILQIEVHRGKGFGQLCGPNETRAQGSWFPVSHLPPQFAPDSLSVGLSTGLDQDRDFLKIIFAFIVIFLPYCKSTIWSS